MRARTGIRVLSVAAVSVLALAAATASGAARSCGTVQAKYPSGATHGFVVKVTKGTIACPAADTLIKGVYLAPGVTGSGANTNVETLKSGWRCVFPAAPPGPVTCTKGRNRVRATPTP